MRPARRGAPAALRLPARLAPSLGLLLLRLLWCPQAARGDCGFPPDMPNATVMLENHTIFPVGTVIGYYCNPGFVKIIGKVNVVHCLANSQWTKPAVFCQRSCGITPSVPNAHKKDIYIPVSYYPAGFVVEYECNPGFARNHSVSGNVTCLEDYTWSKSEVFCYRKSCPDPGKINNGHISIPTDILFTSEIYFSCDPGYKLVGVNSTFCDYEGDNMIWENPFPLCQEIPTTAQKPSTTDVPSTRIQSTTQKTSSVDVTGTEFPSASQKRTTINVPATKAPSAPQKPTTINVKATKSPSTLQKPTTINVPATKAPSAPQKPTTVTIPATKAPSAPQKPTTVTIPATKSPSAPQKPTTVTIPATKSPSAPQKHTTVSVPSMEGTPALQNLTTRSSSTTKALLSLQKDTSPVLAMDTPPTSQKPFAASDSATIVKTSVSNALSTETQLTVQTLLMTNASATQVTSKPQSFTTAKASYAQSLPVTQKFSTVHAPMTKGHHTTQRLTSAHIAVTQNQIVFTRQSTSKGSGFPTAGVTVIASGHTFMTLTVLFMMLVAAGYLT